LGFEGEAVIVVGGVMLRSLLVAMIMLATHPIIAGAASQVPCAKVLSELNKMRRSEDKLILAMEKVAKKLDTSPIWVENCMRIYGRTVPQRVTIDPEQREDVAEIMEESDPAPEDRAVEDLREPDEPVLPERDTAGSKKREEDEYINRYEYLPQ
jgi:hypothetical protein